VTELGAAERNLLAVLAEADEPTEADRERVRALVLQRVATATGIAAATYVAGSAATGAAATGAAASGAAASGAIPTALASSTTASTAIASSGAATVVATTAAVTWKGAVATKIAAALVSVGVASGAGWYAVKSQAPAQPAVSVQAPQAAPLTATPEPVAAVQPVPAAEPVVEAPKPVEAPALVHRPAAADPKANDHLSDEADLLKRVQRAINSGDTGTALTLLQQHATTYPSGVLVQERIGLRAITLCRAGQRDQGVAEATRFLKGNPSSPLSERVKSACELK
jgi:hypothetical protein